MHATPQRLHIEEPGELPSLRPVPREPKLEQRMLRLFRLLRLDKSLDLHPTLEFPMLRSDVLDWSHRLMRLIMKYREVVGLGEAAQELLNFSRRTRAIDALLRDGARAGLVLVSLDEPIVIAETRRLARALQTTGVSILGEIRNRVSSRRARVTSDPSRPLFVAPELEPPPIGVAAIRDWCERWSEQD